LALENAMRASLFVASALLVGTSAAAQSGASDSSRVLETVAAFHRALAQGDSMTALRLLADDAIILESGGRETKAEYRAHHLPGDIAFARAVAREPQTTEVRIAGEVAWVTSTSVTSGTFRDRPVNSTGVELMVLSRTPSGWAIRAIHWSSRQRRPPTPPPGQGSR
jgi:ketosteroid isomerase-like protein